MGSLMGFLTRVGCSIAWIQSALAGCRERWGKAQPGPAGVGGRDRKESLVLVSNFGHQTSTFIVENVSLFPGRLQPRKIVMPPSVPEGGAKRFYDFNVMRLHAARHKNTTQKYSMSGCMSSMKTGPTATFNLLYIHSASAQTCYTSAC